MLHVNGLKRSARTACQQQALECVQQRDRGTLEPAPSGPRWRPTLSMACATPVRDLCS